MSQRMIITCPSSQAISRKILLRKLYIISFHERNPYNSMGENKLIIFIKKRLALADVERFKGNVREEAKNEKRP